jgi:lipid II:glycine glycyltransferase (peptidoglycan interpeptide bridge formation enzyme)
MGTFRHDWIKQKKREGGSSKAVKFLRQIYTTYSEDELELLAKINTTEDLKQLARKHGWDDRRIKSEL